MHKKRQKPKNLKAALSNLFSYCKKEAGIILFALIMAALGAVLTIAGPNQISKITDYIYNGLTGGISTEAVQEDIQKQIQSGQINIMDYLPEGTDPSSIDFQNLDLTDKNSELAQNIVNNIRLSDEFRAAHQDDGIDMNGIFKVAVFLLFGLQRKIRFSISDQCPVQFLTALYHGNGDTETFQAYAKRY